MGDEDKKPSTFREQLAENNLRFREQLASGQRDLKNEFKATRASRKAEFEAKRSAAAEKAAAAKAERAEKAALAKAERERIKEIERQNWERLEARRGPEIMSVTLGKDHVRLYKNGYVSFGLPLIRHKSAEKLLGITGDANVVRKSAAGRGVAAVLTVGFNLYGSKNRGDLYLNIITERQTKSIHIGGPTPQAVGDMKRFCARAQIVLDSLDN